MRPLLETLQLLIGCYAFHIFVMSFLIFLTTVSYFGTYALWFLLLMGIFALIGILYYIYFSKDRLKRFEDMLIKKAKKSLALPENTEVLILSKKGSTCNLVLTKSTRKNYEIGFIFLTNDYLTIAQKCPKFHMFKLEKHGRDKKWAIKDSCSDTREYRYPFIQSAHYDTKEKSLAIVLTSGYPEYIPCDKKVADKALIKIRGRLRDSDRTIQTNLWHE